MYSDIYICIYMALIAITEYFFFILQFKYINIYIYTVYHHISA